MPDALSLPRSELPEEIEKAITEVVVYQQAQVRAEARGDRATDERARKACSASLEALSIAIVSRLSAANASREEAEAELEEAVQISSEALALVRKHAVEAMNAEAARDAALARVERLEKRVNAALDDACRMSAILLMAGEMSPQERRTAQAVANGLAAKVRTALTEAGRLAIKEA